MSRNELDKETSPYLLQHKDNPVHWRGWSKEALDDAKANNKPILLSVGYAACHWCHVMAHESFENAETAQLMNDNFISIKVDREERPDIDSIYQMALQTMGQQGGWPLTMFLTPAGEPIGGGTYFPPEEKFGRPAFKQVLQDVSRIMRDTPDQVEKTRTAIRERLDSLWTTDKKRQITRNHLDLAAKKSAQAIDIFSGGLEGAPKFPQVPLTELLWRAFLRTGARPFAQSVVLTLDNMCQGGIYDHVGGGFARYSVDESWLVPHFEKMLYDNASLIDVLTLLWQGTRSPLYKQRIDETAEFLIREMVTEGGGFASSLDADSEGEEGKFYVWSEAEIDQVLTPERSGLFKQVYDVRPTGNWEGKTILHRLRVMNYLSPEQEALLAGQRKQLFKARERRVHPARDDKVLADWNGLAIAALANAAAVFQKAEYHLPAVRAFWFVAEKMVDPKSGGDRLLHSHRLDRAQHKATLDDYASMSRAALALFETTGDQRYLNKVVLWARALDRHFWDDERGGYFTTANDADDLFIRAKLGNDNAWPNGNGLMMQVLTRLSLITGDGRYRKRAEEIINAFGSDIERAFLNCSSLLNGFDFLLSPLQITVIRPEQDPRAAPLFRAIYDKSLPNRLVSVHKPDEELPKQHPAHGKGMIEGKPTVYVCLGSVCSAPITDPKALEQVLARQTGAAAA